MVRNFYFYFFLMLVFNKVTSKPELNANATYTVENICIVNPSSITDFPNGLFTKNQLQRGAVCFYIFGAVYFFTFLAFICDKYFLPTIERICDVFNISPDIAATTFMATATTIPEFFTNTVSTFIAGSDMGLSSIVGSAMFNTLGVAACASFFTRKPIQIDWWPITRDSILFCIIVAILTTIAWDGVIMWYETSILVAIYISYWTLMFQNKRVMGYFKNIIENNLKWCQRIKNYDIENQRPKSEAKNSQNSEISTVKESIDCNEEDVSNKSKQDVEVSNGSNTSVICQLWYYYTLPMRFLLKYTIPDPLYHKNLYVVSFIMCIVWIASTSYMDFWMIVTVGDVFRIPETVMGFTILAFGGCMPEAISAVIVARKGSGEMGVSNALGANCLAILFSLGIPWFIKTMIAGAGWTNAQITIFSYGMEYTILSLIFAVFTLYLILAFYGYKLRKKTGIYLSISYFLFATFGILMEYNVFLVGAPDEC